MLDALAAPRAWQAEHSLAYGITLAAGLFLYVLFERYWRTPFPREEIASAAIRYPDIGVLHLPAPARHHTIIWTRLLIDGQPTKGDCAQGFVTTRGRFVDRAEAFEIALARGQIEHKHGGTALLYSEDLWPTPHDAKRYTIDEVDEL